jgi:hypothetical protein
MFPQLLRRSFSSLTKSLHHYGEVYNKTNWPKHHITSSVLTHFNKLIQNFPETESKINFFKINDEDHSFVLTCRQYVHYDSLSENDEKFKEVISKFDYSSEKFFPVIREELSGAVYDLIKDQKLETKLDLGYRTVLVEDFKPLIASYKQAASR